MTTHIFYGRVSTTDQSIDIQLQQAREAGYTFESDDILCDDGVSGVSIPLAERPHGRRLQDKLRRGDVLVVRWLDRLGRDYDDVTDTMRLLMRRGVIVRTLINGMVFDGSAIDAIQIAVRDTMIALLAGVAQSQAEATAAARDAGIAAAREKAPHKYLGRRPSYTREQLTRVMELLAAEVGSQAIARETGLSRQTVVRIKSDPVQAETALRRWEGAEIKKRQDRRRDSSQHPRARLELENYIDSQAAY